MRAFGLIMAIGLLAAACTTVGTSDTSTTTAPTVAEEQPPTTAQPIPSTSVTAPSTSTSTLATPPPSTTTTTTLETTTTTSGALFTAPQPLTLQPPAPLQGSEGATGSGCAPGTTELPDGVWYGFVSDVSWAPERTVAFDLACFWFGDIAWDVAATYGDEADGDFYITNDNPAVRMAPVGADAVVWTIAGDPTEGHSVVPFDDWPPEEQGYIPCPGDWCGVWLYVNGGVVTEIVEQYIP